MALRMSRASCSMSTIPLLPVKDIQVACAVDDERPRPPRRTAVHGAVLQGIPDVHGEGARDHNIDGPVARLPSTHLVPLPGYVGLLLNGLHGYPWLYLPGFRVYARRLWHRVALLFSFLPAPS